MARRLELTLAGMPVGPDMGGDLVAHQLQAWAALAVALEELADALDRMNRTTEAEATRDRLASVRSSR